MKIINSYNQKIINKSTDHLIRLIDHRNFYSRIIDFFISQKKELDNRKNRKLYSTSNNNTFSKLNVNIKYDRICSNGSSTLIVLIHGLGSSPLAWNGYLNKSNCDYFIPYVYKKGHCKIYEAADPILKTIQLYSNDYPDNKIFLVGHSNGAKIASYVEQRLIADKIYLISIAGPYYGSKIINWIKFFKLESFLRITSKIIDDFVYSNSSSKENITNWQKSNKKIEERIFYASADDIRVFPNETSFPNLPNSKYYLISKESHVTIIDGVKDQIIDYINEKIIDFF